MFADSRLRALQKEMYEKLLARIMTDYKEKLIHEFVNTLAFDQ